MKKVRSLRLNAGSSWPDKCPICFSLSAIFTDSTLRLEYCSTFRQAEAYRTFQLQRCSEAAPEQVGEFYEEGSVITSEPGLELARQMSDMLQLVGHLY